MTPPKACISETANDYDINELPVGLETVAFWTVKTRDVNAFINLSGDKNPLHIDEDYAIQNGLIRLWFTGFLSAQKYLV